MKSIYKYLIPALLAILIPVAVLAADKGKAAIKFSEYSHDFGNVKEQGGPVSCEFVFTNTGTANLVIIDAKATCGCTRPEFPQKPIAPGKTGKIKVTYNPSGRPGPIDRTVVITTNGKPKKVRLHLSGTVIPGK